MFVLFFFLPTQKCSRCVTLIEFLFLVLMKNLKIKMSRKKDGDLNKLRLSLLTQRMVLHELSACSSYLYNNPDIHWTTAQIQNRQQNTNNNNNCYNNYELIIVVEKKFLQNASVCLASLDEQSHHWDYEKISHIFLDKKRTASSNCSSNASNNLFHRGHWKLIKW